MAYESFFTGFFWLVLSIIKYVIIPVFNPNYKKCNTELLIIGVVVCYSLPYGTICLEFNIHFFYYDFLASIHISLVSTHRSSQLGCPQTVAGVSTIRPRHF